MNCTFNGVCVKIVPHLRGWQIWIGGVLHAWTAGNRRDAINEARAIVAKIKNREDRR